MKAESYAKINLYLKIVGFKGDYHLLNSRFVKITSIYDTIEFIPKTDTDNAIQIIGDFGCMLHQNTIYKIIIELQKYTKSNKLKNFLEHYKIVVEKNIPKFAGLGGSSSNSAKILRMLNTHLKLNLTMNEMVNLGKIVGSDIAFFLHDYDSASVSSLGEDVEYYEDENIDFDILTPPNIQCSTKEVYQAFRQTNYDLTQNQNIANQLKKMSSTNILTHFDTHTLNDLYLSASTLYPELKQYQKNRFFSGSGSSFFKKI